MSNFKKNISQLGAGLLIGSAACAQTPPSAVELVDALNGVFGKQAGTRASHAKGMCAQGAFHPDAQALTVTEGPLWHKKQVPLQARFSVGGGNPKASDKGKTVRGLALHIGSDWDLVLMSAPVFMVATPEEFVGFMQVRQPDPATGKPNPERVKSFNSATPSTQAQIAFLEKAPIPASYAQTPYWGVNAFVMTNAQGKKIHGRWRAEPKAGYVGLTPEQLAQANDDFLVQELTQRLGNGPVVFNLWLQLAQSGDDVKNPSIAWPATNPEVRMGQIEITGLNNTCEPTLFNPAVLPKGMALSEDPTLLVRAGSYGVSLGRRAKP
ncbi:catalase family peroxidase [Limnohabitans sp.]|uniref:catalase family peroxidase n=1 Tax=Limnohabitans sp. TaxID=1907725 RepID=UPI00286F9C35|nr:catalase family peroxidase [Limnohabitans sp.]